MNILFVCNSSLDGGGEKYIHLLSDYFASQGNHIIVATTPNTPMHSWASSSPSVSAVYPIHIGGKLGKKTLADFLFRFPFYYRSLTSSLRHIISHEKVDVAHLQYKKEQLLASSFIASLGVKVVWTEHGNLPRLFSKNPFAMHFYKKAAKSVSGIIGVATPAKTELEQHGITTPVEVIYNGVPTRLVSSEEVNELKKELQLKESTMKVCVVANLVHSKRVNDVIAGFAGFAKERDSMLYIVGDGKERQALEKLAEEENVSDKVVFLGRRNDISVLLAAMDVFALTGVAEGFSLSILEAMQAGLPVIASDFGGNPEQVIHGENGYIVPTYSPASIAEALVRLYESPEERKRFGEASRERLQENFTLEMMLSKSLSFFRELDEESI